MYMHATRRRGGCAGVRALVHTTRASAGEIASIYGARRGLRAHLGSAATRADATQPGYYYTEVRHGVVVASRCYYTRVILAISGGLV